MVEELLKDILKTAIIFTVCVVPVLYAIAYLLSQIRDALERKEEK